MADTSGTRLWVMRSAFVALAVTLVFFQLLPLDTATVRWTGPDLLVALVFAWVMRRPEYVPALSVALVFLLADLLFQRPPGLMAALMVAATEGLKSQSAGLRDQPFPMEWASVTISLVLVFLGHRLVLAIFMVPQAPLGLTLIQLLMTALAYPLAVAITRFVFGIRKVAPGEMNALGQRI